MAAITHNARWKLAAVLAFTIVVSLFDRMNITYALPKIAEEFGWNAEQTAKQGGWLMSIFFIAYGLANIFLTPFIQHFGARKILLTIILLWSVFTCLGPLTSQTLGLFLLARVLLGLAESPHFPMMNALSKQWFPPSESSRGNSVWASGMFFAMILSPLVLVPLTEAYGWRTAFIVIALMGTCLSWPLVYWFIHDAPATHPRISDTEKAHIEGGRAAEAADISDDIRAVGIKHLLVQPEFIILCLASITHYILVYGIVSWMPTWLTQEKQVAYGDLSWALTIPYLFSLLGLLLWSTLGDKTDRRSQIAAIAYLFAGVSCVFATSTVGLWDSIVILSAAVFFSCAFNSAEFALLQRIVPAHLNTQAGGIYNGLGVFLGGGLGPVVTGYLASATQSFSTAISYLGTLTIIASLLMGILAYRLKH